jgi:hypothetical protein
MVGRNHSDNNNTQSGYTVWFLEGTAEGALFHCPQSRLQTLTTEMIGPPGPAKDESDVKPHASGIGLDKLLRAFAIIKIN